MSRKFILSNLVLTLILGVVGWVLRDQTGVSVVHPYYLGMLTFFLVQSLVVERIRNLGVNGSAEKVTYILGGVVFRLLTAVFFLVIAIVAGVKEHEVFVINSVALYLVYLVFEITTVLTNLRPHSKEN